MSPSRKQAYSLSITQYAYIIVAKLKSFLTDKAGSDDGIIAANFACMRETMRHHRRGKLLKCMQNIHLIFFHTKKTAARAAIKLPLRTWQLCAFVPGQKAF